MFNLRIFNKKYKTYFEETYYSYSLLLKRINKLKYSRNFVVTSWYEL